MGRSGSRSRGNRTTPPTIESVSPRAVARGIPQELKIEGFNLAGTRAIYFSDPGVEARISGVKEIPAVAEEVRLGAGGLPSTIDLGPLPSRYEVAVELDIPLDAPHWHPPLSSRYTHRDQPGRQGAHRTLLR